VKSVISVLPLFYFSFYKAPTCVCNAIRKIQAKFVWDWGSKGRKIAWVRWEKICRLMEEGGLGIRDIGRFNSALLAKWKWRLGTEGGGLWRDVLISRYGPCKNMVAELRDTKCST